MPTLVNVSQITEFSDDSEAVAALDLAALLVYARPDLVERASVGAEECLVVGREKREQAVKRRACTRNG